jgi:hypothetical protein
MASEQTVTPVKPRPTCVMVILTEAADQAARGAVIELWTPGGNGPGPRHAPAADLTSVLKQAAEISGDFGFHGTYEFSAHLEAVASYVVTAQERRDAIAEIREQRRRLESETMVGQHRADGTRKTDSDRASATAMTARLGALRDVLMTRGFAP